MNIADYVLTEHAELEMSRRQVEPEWVATIMAAPEQIVEGFNGRKVFQSRIESGGKTSGTLGGGTMAFAPRRGDDLPDKQD